MKYFILGSNGFIGSNILKTLKKLNLNVVGLDRKKFDITDENCYKNFEFSNSIIIDAIASIDSNSDEIFKVNVDGVKKFSSYLNLNCKDFKYIYISTTSTQIKDQVENNDYIKSKFLAETYIKDKLNNYQIIRLIFPFGKGEKPNRLISRLISRIKQNEQLIIDNVTLNLTPIEFFNKSIITLIKSSEREINFTDGKVYRLKDIVDYIYKELKNKTKYIYNKDNKVKLNINDNTLISRIIELEDYIEEML